MEENERITYGTDNVFDDLGFANPEDHLVKAKLVLAISRALKVRGITQVVAAEILGIDQPKVSKLLRGHFRGFSTERLLHFLNLLGQDVIITIISQPLPENRNGHISVAMA